MIGKSVKREKLVGKKAVPVHNIINNSGSAVSKGTVCTITDTVQGRGLTIETEKCPYCGQYARITGVKREEMEFYDFEKHGKPFLSKDMRKLLCDISYILNKSYGQEFALKRFSKEEYPSAEEWIERNAMLMSCQEYEDKLEAFEIYKRIETMLGR